MGCLFRKPRILSPSCGPERSGELVEAVLERALEAELTAHLGLWASVVTDLRNRGVRDILIACCDGCERLPSAYRPDVR
jgi:transposase-like protein